MLLEQAAELPPGPAQQVLLEQQMHTMGAERCLAAGMQQLESTEQARLSCHARVSARARARV